MCRDADSRPGGAVRPPTAARATAVFVCVAAGLFGACCAAKEGGTTVDKRWNTIWTFYDYPKGTGPLVSLNLKSWAKHNPEMKIVLLNDSNVKDYIPDMPEEFFKMPYQAAKSDVIRAGSIYHHGGLYMDTDFLVMHTLAPVLNKLEEYEIVSYSDGPKQKPDECGNQFSSNWHAGRKGNAFSTAWWANIKHILTRQCEEGEFVDKVEKVCCHEKGPLHEKKEKRRCHIPWAHIEHLKTPALWAKKHSDDTPPPHMWPKPEEKNGGIKMFCLSGAQTLTPQIAGQIFWQPWNHEKKETFVEGAWVHKKRFRCHELSSGDMACSGPGVANDNRLIRNFFGRAAYHLFYSTFMALTAAMRTKTEEDVLKQPMLISYCLRRSLGLEDTHGGLVDINANLTRWLYGADGKGEPAGAREARSKVAPTADKEEDSLFTAIDRNGDGKLTREEFAEATKIGLVKRG